MKPTPPRLVLYGNSVLLAGIKADLRGRTPLELVTIGTECPNAGEQIHRLNPSVVVFDLAAAQPGFAVSLLRHHPDVLLLGLDPSNDEMLVLAGRPERALSVEDLVRVCDAHLGKRQTAVYWQSEQHQFKKEIEMKNLSKRNKILLSVIGAVVVLVVAVVLTVQIGGGSLFGTIYMRLTPQSVTMPPGRTVELRVPRSTPFTVGLQDGMCSWSSTIPSVVSVQNSRALRNIATSSQVPSGAATVHAQCGGFLFSASIGVTLMVTAVQTVP